MKHGLSLLSRPPVVILQLDRGSGLTSPVRITGIEFVDPLYARVGSKSRATAQVYVVAPPALLAMTAGYRV